MSFSIFQSRLRSVVHRVVSFGLMMSVILPASLVGDEPVAAIGADAVLHDNGTLRGIVVDDGGHPVAAAEVQILYGTDVVAATVTDMAGRFSIRSLRNGTHIIQASGVMHVVRLWGASAAPPAASESVTIVVHPDPVIRGQAASTSGLIRNPWLIAGFAGVVIGAVMIIEHQDDDNNNNNNSQPSLQLASP